MLSCLPWIIWNKNKNVENLGSVKIKENIECIVCNSRKKIIVRKCGHNLCMTCGYNKKYSLNASELCSLCL
jgi:hypothetical protein